jgi:hypothetical protein
MTANGFRRIALGMSGAVEGAHMGHPDFRVGGRIFATIHGDQQFGMVKLTPDQQQQFVREHPDTFAPESGAWGRQGCTSVRLKGADDDAVGEAMTLAWQNTVAREPVKRAGKPRRSPRRNTRARRP